MLCALRALQGAFSALLTPSTLAVIIHVFPRNERAKAIGTWTALSSVAGVIGPFVGGLLITAGSWRLIFAINVPLVLVTLALVARGVPKSAGIPVGGRVDLPGAILAIALLGGPIYALIELPRRGFDNVVLGSAVVGALAAIAFVAREARARAPMLPLSLFGERNFAIGNIATLTTYLGLGGVIFLVPLFLQQVASYSPIQAGLALLPVTALMILLSRRFGALAAYWATDTDGHRSDRRSPWGATPLARRPRSRLPVPALAGAPRLRAGFVHARRAPDRDGPGRRVPRARRGGCRGQ
jgi:MFS family permease